MKPRVKIAETTLPDGSVLTLQEHDGRHYLLANGVQVAGPATRAGEREMARLACAPFRPARQPKIWLSGLALGEALAGAIENLPQKRLKIHVAEPSAELVRWNREFLPDGPLAKDGRIELSGDPGPQGLAAHQGTLHAVLLHADTSPLNGRGRPLFEEARWLGAAYEALQPGGLLAIGSSLMLPKLERALQRGGFQVIREEIEAAPNARRSRRHFVWLARKGNYDG